MSRTKKFIKNTMATALLQITTMITGFIVPKIMLSYYGSEINGLVTSISQLIVYMTLIESGLSNAIVYSLYKPLSENNKTRINSILSAARNFYNRTGYLFLSVAVGASLVYPFFIKTQVLNYYEVVFLFLILAVNGVLEFFSLAKYRALLTADQRIYVISLASIIQVVINVVIISVLSMLGASIVVTRLIAILAILVRTIILQLYCKWKYDYLDFSEKPDWSSLDKRWDALYLQLIGVIHTGAPVLIATFLLGLKEVSIYSIYNIVIIGMNGILGIFTNGLYSSFGDLLVRDDKETFRKAFTQFEFSYYILITIVYSVMIITFIPFMRIYTSGADISYIFPILALLMTINGYLYNLKTPYGMLTISAGKYRESRIQITIQGALEVVLGILFGIKWGLNGIILGAIVSNLYRNIDFIFFSPKHLTHYSFKGTLKMWARSITIVIAVFIIWNKLPIKSISSYLDWINYALGVGVIITIGTIAINILTDYKLFNEVLRRISSLILKNR